MTQLNEALLAGVLSEARISRDRHRIGDVPILGRESQNGRIYTREAMREATSLYSGAKVFLDHEGGERSLYDLVGRVENPRFDGDRIRGDVHVLNVQPGHDLIFSLAEQMPDLVGMSHQAEGEVRVDENGVQIVESINEVRSVDLVTEPATVSGLYESVCHGLACEKKKDVEEGLRERGVPDELIEQHAPVIERTAQQLVGGELEIPETALFGEAKTVTEEKALDDLAERLKAKQDEMHESRRRRRRDRRSSSGGGVASKARERDWDSQLSRRRNGHPPPSDEDVADAANRLFT